MQHFKLTTTEGRTYEVPAFVAGALIMHAAHLKPGSFSNLGAWLNGRAAGDHDGPPISLELAAPIFSHELTCISLEVSSDEFSSGDQQAWYALELSSHLYHPHNGGMLQAVLLRSTMDSEQAETEAIAKAAGVIQRSHERARQLCRYDQRDLLGSAAGFVVFFCSYCMREDWTLDDLPADVWQAAAREYWEKHLLEPEQEQISDQAHHSRTNGGES